MNNTTSIRYVFAIGDLDKVSNQESNRVYNLLKEIAFNTLSARGNYEGQEEHSFYVNGDVATEAFIRQICGDYKQDSYLKIYNDNHVDLVLVKDGSTHPLGEWTNVGETKPVGDYSYINGVYFNIK